jgi:hypothetical protein
LTYDNLGLAVATVGKGKERKLTKKFKELLVFELCWQFLRETELLALLVDYESHLLVAEPH